MSCFLPKDERILNFITNDCPKIFEKLQGKLARDAVLHTEITRVLEKPDCDVTEIELAAWEAELTSVKKAPAVKKRTASSRTAPEKGALRQMELDLA